MRRGVYGSNYARQCRLLRRLRRAGRFSDADAVRQFILTIDQSVRRAATAPAEVGLDDRAQMRQCAASSASPPTKRGVVSPRMERSNSKWAGGRVKPVPRAFKQA